VLWEWLGGGKKEGNKREQEESDDGVMMITMCWRQHREEQKWRNKVLLKWSGRGTGNGVWCQVEQQACDSGAVNHSFNSVSSRESLDGGQAPV
jgi:hypothetical protein